MWPAGPTTARYSGGPNALRSRGQTRGPGPKEAELTRGQSGRESGQEAGLRAKEFSFTLEKPWTP